MATDHRKSIAGDYEKYAAVAEEAGARLLGRMDGLRFSPKLIVELGCATGRDLSALRQRFPKAIILGIDRSRSMLREARRRKGWWRPRFQLAEADAASLPLADHSADMAFVNLTPSWCGHPGELLSEARRVLEPGGLLLVSVFGPDTLRELSGEQTLSIQSVMDVQALGRELVQRGFSEPVLDTDWLTTNYSSRETMIQELNGAGFLSRSSTDDVPTEAVKPVSIKWEIVSASAWAPQPGQPIRSTGGEEVSIPVSQIGRRQRRSSEP